MVLKAEDDHAQDQPCAPPNGRVQHVSVGMGQVTKQGGAKIKRHDGCPQEHCHGGEVSKVSKDLAKIVFNRTDVEDHKKERCQECSADNVAQDNLAMETVELRDNQIDNEDNGQRNETKGSKDSEQLEN